MLELLSTFIQALLRSMTGVYNFAFALSIVLLLTDFSEDRKRLPFVAIGHLAFAFVAVWILGTISDMIFPNTITWTLAPVIACGFAFNGWRLPMRLTRMALTATAWMYSIAFAEVANATLHGGTPLAATVSFAYMLVLWVVLELLERRAPLGSRSMTLLMVAPVLVICASGFAARSILILRSDFGIDSFYEVSTLESILTCLNGQIAELVTYGLILHLVSELSEKDRLVEEQHVTETQLAGLRAYQESAESFHELRHEVKNQYAYIKLLLEQKDYERAEQFFGEMSMRANPTFAYVATGNQLVDSIVNLEYSRAKSAGVILSCRVAVPPELPFSETDLCGLLTNLLDNAIEACSDPQIPDENKTVRLGMVVDQGALVVTVANPCAKPPRRAADGHFRTTKADGRRHGYGTTIIRKIAEQNGGVADFSYKNGVFTARVMLLLGDC